MATQLSKKCPECKKRFRYSSVREHKWFPFCSETCKLVDLGRWYSNEYAFVEDLSRGHDMKDNINLDEITDPDVRAALEELEGEHG
ncbi:MAG: DNA gyrase inhibitor YacG [Planctomycetes bacterium]|nr:DNA gyrase inhibitor YacG [Planctomycetota bacterium]